MAELSTDERTALDCLEGLLADGLHTQSLADLVAIPSVTGTPAESEAQHWAARRCEHLGLEVDLWPMDLDELRAAPGFPGTEAARDEAWGMVAQTPVDASTSDQPMLVLQGHLDVVPPGDPGAWAGHDPFDPRVVDGVLYGRGACDMKAGVVANLLAVEALRRSDVRLACRVSVQTVVSEEDGGLGAFGTLVRGHRGDACIITEPTEGTVITANGGALTFTLTVHGAATHGSTRYAGVSAIEKFELVHAALRELESTRNRDVGPLMEEYPIAYPIMVGRVSAGDWSSTVPDRLVAEGRYGVRIDETPEQARLVFESHVAELCRLDPWLAEHPVEVAWSGGQFAPGAFPATHPFVGQVQQAYDDVTGRGRPRQRGAPYGSDLRLYNGAGVPALHLGPGEVRHAHAPSEQVRLDELADTARALVVIALRFGS
ncbi:MAG: ArgE/DapE family deacylase [Actinomycetes bacterium]